MLRFTRSSSRFASFGPARLLHLEPVHLFRELAQNSSKKSLRSRVSWSAISTRSSTS
jgi:hypothetical protein